MSIGIYTAPVTVALNPTQVVMSALASVTFTATVSGSTGSVRWSVDGIAGGNSTVGTIVGGVYTAPWQAGKHVVKVDILDAEPPVSANASINVNTTATAVTVQTTVPTEASYIGALIFDSATSTLYVYTASGWVVA